MQELREVVNKPHRMYTNLSPINMLTVFAAAFDVYTGDDLSFWKVGRTLIRRIVG